MSEAWPVGHAWKREDFPLWTEEDFPLWTDEEVADFHAVMSIKSRHFRRLRTFLARYLAWLGLLAPVPDRDDAWWLSDRLNYPSADDDLAPPGVRLRARPIVSHAPPTLAIPIFTGEASAA